MSNLWRHDRVERAAPVGSFAIGARAAQFRPWAGGANDDLADDMPEPVAAPTMAQAAADAFAEGFEAGRRTVELEIADEREAVAQLARSLDALRPEPTDALAALLAETVDRLVRRIVGDAVVAPELIVERARAAAALLGEELAPSKLRANPDDAEILSAAHLPVEVVADASITRGSIRLETASGWIEDGPAMRLDRLRGELDRLGAC